MRITAEGGGSEGAPRPGIDEPLTHAQFVADSRQEGDNVVYENQFNQEDAMTITLLNFQLDDLTADNFI